MRIGLGETAPARVAFIGIALRHVQKRKPQRLWPDELKEFRELGLRLEDVVFPHSCTDAEKGAI